MSYPATITINRPEHLANWRPIIHVILAMPHFVILHTVLNVAASITAIAAWLAVLFKGNVPAGIAAFHATYVRYRARTFSYMFFLTDKYPPFNYRPSMEDPGDAGISIGFSPSLEGKSRLNVLFRFIVPFAWVSWLRFLELIFGVEIFDAQLWLVALVMGAVLVPGAVFAIVTWFMSAIACLIGAVAVVFTGRWPDGLFRLTAAWVRIDARLWAYGMLLTDRYPPAAID